MAERQAGGQVPFPRLVLDGVVLAAGRAPLSETVMAGEIVGLAGLDGHGQEALLEIMAGLRAPDAGSVRIGWPDGTTRPVSRFRRAASEGIAYLPRDRRATGIFPTLSILDNFAIASMRRDSRAGLISPAQRRERYEGYRRRLAIVAPDPSAPITALSGGNQQKVLLARWLARHPDILLLNDPTRGVDIATRQALYGVIRELAADGMALVLLSTEIEEVLQLCDRVLVFRDREIAARLSGESMNADAVIASMFGRAA
jgi:ribose transport system ATP-binding protein